jgi:dTDP-glucose 4,6-dehydratase
LDSRSDGDPRRQPPLDARKKGARGGDAVPRARTRVLVTGGAGFISSSVIRHLLAATPYEVVSLDALTYAGNLENLADVLSHPRLSFVHGDIRDAGLVHALVEGVDVIVNAAAESHVEKSIRDGASEFVTTNVEGTQILLDAIRRTPIERFVHVSSSEVYGTARYAPMDEEHPLEPRSPYAATKAGADRLAYAYFVTYDLPIVVVRPFNNYGPRQHPEKVVPRFATQALLGEPLTIHGDGHATRDWLYVADDAEAIQAAIEAPLDLVAGEVVNVATGVDVSVAEIADMVLDALGAPRELRVFLDERPGQVDRHIGSTDKAARVLGWRARTELADGLERTVAWYRENEAWWRGILARSARAFSS